MKPLNDTDLRALAKVDPAAAKDALAHRSYRIVTDRRIRQADYDLAIAQRDAEDQANNVRAPKAFPFTAPDMIRWSRHVAIAVAVFAATYFVGQLLRWAL